MEIDFDQFVTVSKAVIPVKGNRFQFNRKKYQLDVSDGWYMVEMRDNEAKVIEEAFVTDDDVKNYKTINGYTYNNNIIFHNFDVGKRLFELEIQAPLSINNIETFSAVKAVYWEDKNFYPVSVNYNDVKIFEIKNAFDEEESLTNMKGVTPELRMLYVFHEMQRKTFLEALKKAKDAQDKADFLRSLPGRVEAILKRVSGILISCVKNGNRITVDWKIDGGTHEYNTVLNADTMEVIEAGYCMNNMDRDHNLTSLVVNAKQWEEDHLIHITRHSNRY